MSSTRPPSLQLLSLNINGLRGKQKRAALFSALLSGPWHVIALQETHHASQAEATQWCREGAGPTAPWDGPSFWAAGTTSSRGVALLFKATSLLSSVSAAAVDPHGRFVAAQCDLCGGQVTLASVYAPVERQERMPFFLQRLLPALPAGTPLVLGGDWNCVAGDQDLVGGQPGTRQHGFHSGLLPLQQTLGLQDAFRHLHPDAREFTHTATSGSSSARIDRWLVSDNLLSAVSAAAVSDTRPGDHYGVTLSLSPAAAPPRGPGVWAMPPFIISHPAFKTLMTAHIQAFLHANPVSPTLSLADRWDRLKADIQDVARNYCLTFHARRTAQLRALRVRTSSARSAYLADPANQHALDQLRRTAADLQQHRQQQAATDALRAGVLLHEYGDKPTFYFHHLHRQRQQATAISQLQLQPTSPLADLCTEAGRQQADSIIVSFFSADSASGMFKELHTDSSAQHVLLSSLDRQLPAEAQQACEGAVEGITLEELHSALKASARGKKPGSDGLPYEFLLQFWDLLGPELLAVLQACFQAQHTASLPTSMTQGVITLLYKGKGSPTLLDSYRPITLLNTDYKLLAKALATRFGPALQHVVDPTQTAFVPGRWIGDNVLCHLEEVDYLQRTGQPGCMVFLDFSKAYDRISRPWVLQCMSSMGFGPRSCKWVSLMLQNTSATATFNGWQSASFPERSGVQQGSPLSPLLYVLAAQPLASHLRHQAQRGVIRPITMPNGHPAPVSHQHADDTTLHVLQPSDAQVALNGSVALFCAASCSQLNASKSVGFLVQAQPLASATVAALPSISFITGQQTIKHLGVRLGYDMPAACQQTFAGIYHAISAKIRHWAARGLSFLGRVHVAKQVLAASLWYHASFQRPSPDMLKQLNSQLRRFVASAQQPSDSDPAVALLQGNLQGSAQLPCEAPGAALFPGELTSSLPLPKGGVGLVHVPTQVQALQAKVISRLLEPERLAWKVFQLHDLSQASQVQPLGYGASILFSTLSTDCLQLPARLRGYVTAFRALHPHRLQAVSAMQPEEVLNELLFFNRQIIAPVVSSASSSSSSASSAAAMPFTPSACPLLISAGVTKVAHLQAALRQQQPPPLAEQLQTMLLALPSAWQSVAESAPTPPDWVRAQPASAQQQLLLQQASTSQLHTVTPHHQLLQAPAEAVTPLSPARVVSWDPSRPWRGPGHQPAQLATPLYLQGDLWGPQHLSLGVWGWGSQPAHQLVVKQASQRLRLIQAFAGKHPLAPKGLICRPRLLPLPQSGQSPAQALQAMEARWVASMQAAPAGTARPRSDQPDSQPAWMTPSHAGRLHWSQRQQQRDEQQQQQHQQHPQQPQMPSEQAAADDTVDVLEACGSHPQQSLWQHLWELSNAAYFDRQHRILWWRILHGSLMCGAYRAYIGRATPEQASCPFSCCSSQPQTISHLFLECPVSATLTSWLCSLWQAITGHLPEASVATLLAADTPVGHAPSEAMLQTWHRLRLAVLHSTWAASQIARANLQTRLPSSSSSPSSSLPSSSPSSSPPSTSYQGHLASRLALKTVISMIQHDWAKCSNNIKQVAGVCTSWLRGRDPSMTVSAFQSLWCHHDVMASVREIDGQLDLRLHLSASCPVSLW